MHEKKLMRLCDVKFINVARYDELAVTRMWPLMKDDKQFMEYMPSKLPKGRTIDRQYFWNILNSLKEDYVREVIAHANDQRNTVQHESMEANAMEITDDWLEKLQQIPFISCKWLVYV